MSVLHPALSGFPRAALVLRGSILILNLLALSVLPVAHSGPILADLPRVSILAVSAPPSKSWCPSLLAALA
eukprot:1161718-Pelagomonas_calceolata.AAC.3